MNTVLKIDHVTKRFGNLTAVNDLSLEVYEGEIFGFLGPNGAGKSTSINIMSGLLKADSGKVFVKGIEIDGGNAEIKSHVGVCPQQLVLWTKLTCYEQLVFIARMYGVSNTASHARALKLLKDLGLQDKKNKLANTLSGGMQRRLNILLALVHNPDIIVLDEPEAGLDPQSRVLVRDYIKSLSKKKTVILTTHNMDEAERVCDRISIIDHGAMLITGTPDELKKSNGTGDILEINVNHLSEIQTSVIKELLKNIVLGDCIFVENTISIKSHGIVEKLHEIFSLLKNNNIIVKDVKFRENTLEDVFISLTGRKLRE